MSYSEYKMWLQDDGNSPPAVNSKIEERILNHWDNMAGHVERGYSGNSLFFKNGNIDYEIL